MLIRGSADEVDPQFIGLQRSETHTTRCLSSFQLLQCGSSPGSADEVDSQFIGLDENGRYSGSVAENLEPGADVITVTATDRDEFPDFKKVCLSFWRRLQLAIGGGTGGFRRGGPPCLKIHEMMKHSYVSSKVFLNTTCMNCSKFLVLCQSEFFRVF